MNIKLKFLVILFAFISFLSGCEKNKEILSNDKQLSIATNVQEGILWFTVRDVIEDKDLFTINTGASGHHGWNLKWKTNSWVVLRSKDIGTVYWKKNTDGIWYKKSPYKVVSPNGSFELYTYLGNTNEGARLAFKILKVNKKGSVGNIVLSKRQTNLKIDVLEDCAKWINDDLFVINANTVNYYFERSDNGNFFMKK